MITITSGDLFESKMQTLVNATNTQGIMGGGIAFAFKERYPKMYRHYREACRLEIHTVERPVVWLDPDDPSRVVLSLATKDILPHDSTLENIASGLSWVVANYKDEGITSMAFPALGCGLGGLKWDEVKPLMVEYLDVLDIPVEIYEPQS